MEKGIINIDSLSKDIEQIKYYKTEENQKLNLIVNKLYLCANSYNTNNKNLITEQIDDLKKNIEIIAEKRNKYLEILNNVVKNYETNSINTKKIFGGLNERL